MRKALLGLIFFTCIIYADDYNEITKFANEICGSVEAKGNMEKADINIAFSDKNKEEIIKLLKDAGFEDIKIVDNKIIQKTFKFTGVSREDLSETMAEIRRCKMQVFKNMINKK